MQQPQNIMYQAPPQFKGKADEDANEYITRFAIIQDLHLWTDKIALKQFVVGLYEAAASWYRTLPQETQEDFKELRKSFIERFGIQKNSFFSKFSVFAQKQKSKDTVVQYAAALDKLLANQKMPEDIKLCIFLNGLHKKYKEFVISQHPKTMQEGISAAKLKQNLLDDEATADSPTTVQHV
jgi:hypothetical protein